MNRLLSLIILVAGFVSLPAIAQPSGPATYEVTDAPAKTKAAIDKGIEGAVEDMSFITRPIARGKLEKSNTAFKSISINVTKSTISIQHDDRKAIVSAGKPVLWTRDDGEKFKVTQVAEGGKIVQTYTSDDGKKVMTYNFSDDNKKLKVDVLVTSGKLGGPVKYSLNYQSK